MRAPARRSALLDRECYTRRRRSVAPAFVSETNGEPGSGSRDPNNWKLETGNWKLETGNWELGTGNWKLETVVSKPKPTRFSIMIESCSLVDSARLHR